MSGAVTVVVPTKDRHAVLDQTLRSVLGQVGVEVRVVVVDDGSAEPVVCSDPRVEVVRHDATCGAAASRNGGLARVETDWVAFCDDDDLWAPTKLARQLDVLAADPEAGWCCTGAVCVDGELAVLDDQRVEAGGDLVKRLLTSNVIPGGGSAVLARTALVRDVGAFDEDQPSSEDWDLWIRLAGASPLAVVDEPLVAYRIWPAGKSRQVERMEAGFDAIQDRYRALAQQLGVRGDRARHQRYLAKQALRAGDRLGAARRFAGIGRYERAAFALVAPRLMDRVGSGRMRDAVPARWAAAAESWLAPLRVEVTGAA